MRPLTRRALLAAIGATGAGAASLGQTDSQGNLNAGRMALTQAYNVAGDLWIGPDSSKSTVDADSGRMYFASDTELVYHGDSGSWVRLADSVLKHVGLGKVVAFHSSAGVNPEDPANYNTDAAAVQAANDWLINRSPPGGVVHLPALKSNGNEWDFANTVNFGDVNGNNDATVGLIGHGFVMRNQDIRTTIDDGSDLFVWVPGSGGNQSFVRVANLTVRARNNDVDLFTFQDAGNLRVENMRIRNLHGDAFTFDGAVFNSNISRVATSLNDSQTTPTARSYVFADERNTGNPPGDIRLRDVFTGGPSDVHIATPAEVGQLVVNGHIEGAHGVASVDFTSSAGKLIIGSDCHFGKTSNGAHHVRINNGELGWAPAYANAADGDSVRIESGANHVFIAPTRWDNITGDDINIQSQPAGDLLLPEESVPSGTTTYPSVPWQSDTLYWNGTQKGGVGTVVRAFNSSNQTGLTSDGSTFHTVNLDSTVGSDPFGMLNGSNNSVDVNYDGDYKVVVHISLKSISSGDVGKVKLNVGTAQKIRHDADFENFGHQSFGGTLHGLNAGNSINAEVAIDSASNSDIRHGQVHTFLEVKQVA